MKTIRFIGTREKTQGGSVPLLFVTFILPLLFFLLTLSLDVASYYAEQSATQKVLDDAGMYAYRFLPYQQNALQAAQDYLVRFPNVSAGASISIVADGIELQTQRTFPFMFAKMAGVSGSGITLSVLSRTRGTPFDVAIALDTSDYLSPALTATQGWGDLQNWPSAPYFSQAIFSPQIGAVNPQVLTQQCFNPAFSALKQSAIEALDYFSAFALEAVGVGFYSGNPNLPLEVSRGVRTFSALPAQDAARADAQFITSGKGSAIAEDCAVIAETGSGNPPQFNFPMHSSQLPLRGDFSARPLDLVIPATRTFDPEYQPYLQAREVVWSQLTRDAQPGASAELLTAMFSQLVGAETISARRGLVDHALKVAIIFAGDVPHENGEIFPATAVDAALRKAIENSFVAYATQSPNPSHTHIIYVLLQHEGIPDRGAEAAALQQLFEQERINAGLSADTFSGRVLYVNSGSELVGALMQSLVVLNKTAVVSL